MFENYLGDSEVGRRAIAALMGEPGAVSAQGVGGPQATAPKVNVLGHVGAADIDPIQQALARNEQLRQQRQVNQRGNGGFFNRGAGKHIRNTLGTLGDALLMYSGRAPIYAPAKKQREINEAIARLGANADDGEALMAIYKRNPQLGMAMEDQLHQRTQRGREEEFRDATADMLLGGQDGAGLPGQLPSDAYVRAVSANPEDFLTFQGKRLDVTRKQLESTRELNDMVMQILGGVGDQSSYDRARARAERLLQSYGGDIAELGLPDQYSPELVEQLRLQGMDAAKQMGAIARENRLAWDIEDDQLDNSRADRNQRSLEAHRRGQRANTRRGQDLTSRDRRRGQDIRGPGKGAASGNGAVIRNPKTGERMMLRGGKWVPIK